MTADSRFQRDLPSILEDLYLGPSPDYRHEALAAATRTRQRPAWTFPGRWLPMADITTSRPSVAPRVPWRTLGVALIVIALGVAALVIVAGSRQTRVPPPFGLATNGLIAYSQGGDIFVVDPVRGTPEAITQGPALDKDPVYSPDGTRVAFRRAATTASGGAAEDLVVVADGRETTITVEPIPVGPSRFEWAPDSLSILADSPDDSAIWLFDAAAAAAPDVVAEDAGSYQRAFRPPDGTQILIFRSDAFGGRLIVLDLATGAETVLAKGGSENDYGGARWSPDGSQVVYNNSPLDDNGTQRLFVVNADGSGTRQVTDAPGSWFDIDPAWSPDGSRIAFLRYELVSDVWLVRPIGMLDLATGQVRDVGPLASEVRSQHPSEHDSTASPGEGMFVEWSPDAKSILAFPSESSGHPLVIDPDDGTWHILDGLTDPGAPVQNWQRTAP